MSSSIHCSFLSPLSSIFIFSPKGEKKSMTKSISCADLLPQLSHNRLYSHLPSLPGAGAPLTPGTVSSACDGILKISSAFFLVSDDFHTHFSNISRLLATFWEVRAITGFVFRAGVLVSSSCLLAFATEVPAYIHASVCSVRAHTLLLPVRTLICLELMLPIAGWSSLLASSFLLV